MEMGYFRRNLSHQRTRNTPRILLVFCLAALGLAGCRTLVSRIFAGSPRTEETISQQATAGPGAFTPEPVDSGIAGSGLPAQWPDFIPADIPELEGEIRLILTGSSHVRIFYQNVSMEQVLDYLDLLSQSGFNLEYLVYIQEGQADNSAERIKEGDFDAVDITMGDYHMNLTYGPDPVYDVYLSGFEQQAQEAMAQPWPAELPASVPPIEDCPLQSFYPGGADTYHLTCLKEHDGVEQAYINLLIASAYQEKQGTTVNNLVIETLVYENDDVVIRPELGFSSSVFSLQIYLKTGPEAFSWPPELEGIVPEPDRCMISSILPVSPENITVSCQPADDLVLAEYISALQTSGFNETGRMTDTAGVILSVSLENEEIKVQIMNSGLGSGLMITVKQNQP